MRTKKEKFLKGILTRDVGFYLKSAKNPKVCRRKYTSNNILTNVDKFQLLNYPLQCKPIKNRRNLHLNLFKTHKQEIVLINYLHRDRNSFSNKLFEKEKNILTEEIGMFDKVHDLLPKTESKKKSFFFDLFANKLGDKKHRDKKLVKELFSLYNLYDKYLTLGKLPPFVRKELKNYFLNELAINLRKSFALRMKPRIDFFKEKSLGPPITSHGMFKIFRRFQRKMKTKKNVEPLKLEHLNFSILNELILRHLLEKSPQFKISGGNIKIRSLLSRYKPNRKKKNILPFIDSIFKKKKKITIHRVKKDIKKFLLEFVEYRRLYYYSRIVKRIARSLRRSRGELLEIHFNLTKIGEYLLSAFKTPEKVCDFYTQMVNNYFYIPEPEESSILEESNQSTPIKKTFYRKKKKGKPFSNNSERNKERKKYLRKLLRKEIKRIFVQKNSRLQWEPTSWLPKITKTVQVKAS